MPRELEGRYGFQVNPYAVTPEHVMCRAYTPTGGSTVSNAPGTATVALAPNGMNEAYANDSFGNLTQYGSFLPTYNVNNQMNGFAYDAAGNLLRTGAAALTWDAEGRLTSAGGASYLYDAFGERLESNGITATGTVYFGRRPVARYSGGQWTDLIYGPNGLIAEVAGSENAEPQYRAVDPLGSLVGTMTSNQLLTNPMDYTPFGQVFSGATNAPYFFTGKERDTESGLDYFGARYYGSNMGRFMSPDPLGGHLEFPQSLNKYIYVMNNPLSLTDPTGMDFSLGCGKDNGTTCQGGNTYYKDDKGKYQETMIKSDAKGNLSDQSGNSYTANVSGAGVTFSGNDGTNVSGTFVNGTNATTINGSGGLSNFTFNFTYSETKTGISAGGSFSYAGNSDSAAKALNAAGFNHYFGDNFNTEHPSVKGVYNAVDYRSAGDPNNGALSGHFTLHVPVGTSGPTSLGDLHLGEHNPYTTVPGFLDHAREYIQHKMDH